MPGWKIPASKTKFKTFSWGKGRTNYMNAFDIKYNVTEQYIRDVYDVYISNDDVVGRELTFTVAPNRCNDIRSIKKSILALCVGRVIESRPLSFILTREDHENGWPHIHGIAWYPKGYDNSPTLFGGRLWVDKPESTADAKGFRPHYEFNQLGRTSVYNLRTSEYSDQKDRVWKNHLEYILKDQGINWRNKNAVGFFKKDFKEYFKIPDNDNFVD